MDQLGDEGTETMAMSLAGNHRHNIPLGVDQDERWPGTDGIAPPDDELVVIHDRVCQSVAEDGLPDIVGFAFVREFGGVDPDDHQFGGKRLFQSFQLR
jgi:hypothetical protein